MQYSLGCFCALIFFRANIGIWRAWDHEIHEAEVIENWFMLLWLQARWLEWCFWRLLDYNGKIPFLKHTSASQGGGKQVITPCSAGQPTTEGGWFFLVIGSKYFLLLLGTNRCIRELFWGSHLDDITEASESCWATSFFFLFIALLIAGNLLTPLPIF